MSRKLMRFANATFVIELGHCVTGHAAIRNAFVAIAEHLTHNLVSQKEVLVVRASAQLSWPR
jgi:hypothetical protein